MGNKKKIIAIILNFLFLTSVFAQSAEEKDIRFPQKIEWRGDKNALDYKVELQDLSDNSSKFYTTEESYLDLSLPAGKYRYRVIAYDFLGREASVSDWTAFDILKASKPKIEEAPGAPVVSNKNGSVEIKLNIEDIAEGSIVELIGEPLQGALVVNGTSGEGGEVEDSSLIKFDNVPPGKWRVRVTNPSGLSSESGVIEIVSSNTKSKKEEEPVVIEETVPEEPKEEEPAIQEPVVEESVKEKPKKEKKQKEPKPKKERKPYIAKGFDIMLYAGLPISLPITSDNIFYNGIYDYTNEMFFAEGGGRISFAPIKKDRWRLAFGISSEWYHISTANDYYKLSLDITTLTFDTIYQHRFFHDKLFYSITLGLGLAFEYKDLDYISDYENSGRDSENKKWYSAALAKIGLGFCIKPETFMLFEGGVNAEWYIDAFTVNPYFGFGFRL